MMHKKGWRQFYEVFRKGSGVCVCVCPVMTSGLGVSWVLVPLGSWSLERGRGHPGGALRSKCGGE